MSGTSLTARTATGNCAPSRKRRWEELGIPLPNPEKPKGRNNNRKQTFDAVCRTILFDIARRHGLHLDQGAVPTAGGIIWKNRIIS